MARTGRPSKIDQVVRVREDGTEVTAGQQVVDRVQLGMGLSAAADSAGINRLTLYRWRNDGGALRAREAVGTLPKPTPHQSLLIDFCNRIDRAEAEAEAVRLGILQRAAQGGATRKRVTTKRDGQGNVTEIIEVVETLPPDAQWAAWWLERCRRSAYSPRFELTGAEGQALASRDDAARSIADSLRDFQAGREVGEEMAAEKANGKGKR